MLNIYNTLTRSKAPFQPIDPDHVRMYVCGITVYDYCHLGHARMLLVFDMVSRYMRFAGYNLTYVRNITDIDDKIIKRSQENGEPFDALTARFIAKMHEDEQALGILPPDIEPRATEYIEGIIKMTQQLIERGYAYAANNGDVYYSVSQFDGYGQLSGKNTEELRAGSRVDIEEAKRDPLDFVLWKASKPGEPKWPSPWGEGRPGWHIECSVMSTEHLGNHFDIHGGGMDLQFPHHENEIAQTCGATGETFVNVWVHNGFVRVDEEKMSKSLGNFTTIRGILENHRPETVRYFLLGSHYRSPLNYSDQQLISAEQSLSRLYTALRGLPTLPEPVETEFSIRFRAAMDDDFNTPEAIAVMFDLAREVNRLRDSDVEQAVKLAAELKYLGNVLGLLQTDPDAYFQAESDGLSSDKVEAMIEARQTARAEKNWAEADRLRDELKAQGVVLEDTGGKTTWRRE
ncbi:MAG: cysteine--tRNA ligase [Pseudomonadota bacterium]